MEDGSVRSYEAFELLAEEDVLAPVVVSALPRTRRSLVARNAGAFLQLRPPHPHGEQLKWWPHPECFICHEMNSLVPDKFSHPDTLTESHKLLCKGCSGIIKKMTAATPGGRLKRQQTHVTPVEKSAIAMWRQRAKRYPSVKLEAAAQIRFIQDQALPHVPNYRVDPSRIKGTAHSYEDLFLARLELRTRGWDSESWGTDYVVATRGGEVYPADYNSDKIDDDNDDGFSFSVHDSSRMKVNNLERLLGQEPNEAELHAEGLRGMSRELKKAWNDFLSTWNAGLRPLRKQERADRAKWEALTNGHAK